MSLTTDETKHKAAAWLKWFSKALDADPDIIDSMPIEDVQEELRALGADVEGFHTKLATLLNEPKFDPAVTELKDRIAQEIWEPRYAGQLVAAADIPKQEHVFVTEYGTITVACSWGEQRHDDPAYIWLSWKATIHTERALRICFVNPETQGTRHEINLGTLRAGEETFTCHELGFDPSVERWAITVAI